MKRIKTFFYSIAIITYAISLIIFGKTVSEYVINAVKNCVYTIIPSLFPFMAVSGLIISSGLYYKVGIPFSLISRYIFRTKPEHFSIFLISSVGGYPIGAKLVTELYKNKGIERQDAEKMLGYCYMGGPAFFIGVAGLKIYGSIEAGIVIFVSIFMANIITMFFFSVKNEFPQKSKEKIVLSFCMDKITECISSAGKSIASICSAIVFFSSVIAVLDASGIIAAFSQLISKVTSISLDTCNIFIKSMLEISCISNVPADIEFMPTVTAILSFGGLCVIMQIDGIISNKLSTNNFLFCRIITMILSYFCCKILILIFDISNYIQVYAVSGKLIRQDSPIPSLFLLIMTILLLSKNFIEKNKKI